MKDLVDHLKENSKYQINYEKLDPKILSALNNVSNKDMETYHRNNYLRFKNMSLNLKKNEMLAHIDSIRRANKGAKFT